MKVWVCAIAKMEELYINEWIEYNKSIGIDHIVLGDNNDSNYDHPILPIIQNYIDEGYVTYINLNDKFGYQQNFYNDVYHQYLNDFDWIGFIDIDEFIELPAYNNDIHLFLNDSKFNKYNSIILPWLLHTDNDNIHYECLPVRERFKNIKYSGKSGIKYFIRGYLKELERLISKHNPIRYKGPDNLIKLCDSLGDENFDIVIRDFDKTKFTQIYVKNKPYYKNAYISHYITKSTEEYILYKILRGLADKRIGTWKNRYTKKFYFSINIKTTEKVDLFNQYESVITESINKQKKQYEYI